MALAGFFVIGASLIGYAGMDIPSTKDSDRLGAYQWDDRAWVGSPSTFARSLDRLRSAGVTDLYIDITRAVTYKRKDPQSVAPYLHALSHVLADGARRGIRIHALFGDPEWATTDRQGPLDALAVVRAFDENEAEPLAGVQFDVEPWKLAAWSINKSEQVSDYLAFVDQLTSSFRSLAIPGSLGIAVPYWFDGSTTALPKGNVPLVPLLKSLESVHHPYVVVMAYRNHPTGTNGSIDLMESPMNLAEHTRVVVIVGQEVGDVQPASTTYHARSAADFKRALDELEESLHLSSAFGGFVVDDATGLLALK